MEERKLIKFGKSAFCMTIPHTWLKKNKLKKGDLLTIQETLRNSIEIMPTINAPRDSEELVIDITDRTTDEIIQLLLSTYLNGYTVIILHGLNEGKVAFIRKHVHEYIAAEIMEVTSNKIVIHVFWDIKNIDLNSTIHRIASITRSIFSETIAMIDSDNHYQDITEKGVEVQRQVLLARRAIKYALNDSATAHKFNFSSLELLYVSYIIYFFGMIAEYILKIARIIDQARVDEYKNLLKDESSKKDLKILIQRASEYYSKVIDNYNKKKKLAKFVYSEYMDFEDSIITFTKENSLVWAPLLGEYLKMLIFKIKETEFTMISMENAPK